MEALKTRFAPNSAGLDPAVLDVLASITRLHSISNDELFYKWESYCLKMGSEDTKLDLGTVRMFQKDIQDNVERDHENKHTMRGSEKKPTVGATPRVVSNGNVFGMLDELTPNTINRRSGSTKRKAEFDSPLPRKHGKAEADNSRGGQKAHKAPVEAPQGVPFSQRPNAGQILESINDHLPAHETLIAPHSEPRVKVVANTDIKKFAFKPMSMRLSESSEILDERIDDFVSVVQKHHNLEDSAFGNAAAQSTSEIVAVGRIACDTPEGKLNSASLMLEMSRRTGAGLRVQLKVDALPSYQFFPGQIVALRGKNASGLYFDVTEALVIPQLPMPSSAAANLELFNEKMGASEETSGQALSVMFASGPYTADDNLDFEPLQTVCNKAADDMIDALVLTGPFIDIEHPLIASGDLDMPELKAIDQDASMTTLFRLWISAPLQRLCTAVPSITIILVPSVRDAVSKHVSWPQEQIPKKELNLPKQVKMLPNPCFVSLNEVAIAISSQDVLYELSREQISHNKNTDVLTRLPTYLIEQRHFFPLFPPVSRDKLPAGSVKATGACLDMGYLKLAEWMNVRPDVLLLPSILTPAVRVVENVMTINPGQLSKRRAAGTYAQMTLQPRRISEEEKSSKALSHNVFERARVDVVRI